MLSKDWDGAPESQSVDDRKLANMLQSFEVKSNSIVFRSLEFLTKLAVRRKCSIDQLSSSQGRHKPCEGLSQRIWVRGYIDRSRGGLGANFSASRSKAMVPGLELDN